MKSKTVLIVDDNDLNRKLFENLIGQLFSYESAKNGIEAVSMTEAKDFDLILMDIQMPHMDGITAMKKIRQGRTQCPIIAITAYAEESDRASFFQQGFDDFITKPIRPKEFIQLIQNILKISNPEQLPISEQVVFNGILDRKIVHQLLKYNPKETINGVFDEFLAECAEAESLIEKQEPDKVSLDLMGKIHTLKGNSGTLGAMRIYTSASKVEEYGRKLEVSKFRQELKNLSNEIQEFREFLKQETIFDP